MKNILLIGLGRFGKHIALQLNKLGHEVMAVDSNEERINKILPIVTNAQIGDSTNTEFLKSLGIGNFDVCIVTIGGNFQNSLETTSLLKELGAKLVVSRAERDVGIDRAVVHRDGRFDFVLFAHGSCCLSSGAGSVSSQVRVTTTGVPSRGFTPDSLLTEPSRRGCSLPSRADQPISSRSPDAAVTVAISPSVAAV